MKTYTEEEVRSLVDENLELLKQVESIKDQLSQSLIDRETAERKYEELCERCMKLYITDRDITTDTLFVQLNVPRFMDDSDLATGITQHLISSAKAERDRYIFNQLNTDRCKPIE